MAFHYRTRGVCSRSITLDIVDGKVYNVQFEGGCHGNTQGLAALIDGMDAEDAICRIAGIRCGMKSTSCPDQLALAIREALDQL